LFEYEFPFLPEPIEMPDYANPEIKNSRKPDYRHTLYWNPFVEQVESKSASLLFYSSDLKGEFDVVVEGITSDGKRIYGTTRFQVK
jgi:hypothetical protein